MKSVFSAIVLLVALTTYHGNAQDSNMSRNYRSNPKLSLINNSNNFPKSQEQNSLNDENGILSMQQNQNQQSMEQREQNQQSQSQQAQDQQDQSKQYQSQEQIQQQFSQWQKQQQQQDSQEQENLNHSQQQQEDLKRQQNQHYGLSEEFSQNDNQERDNIHQFNAFNSPTWDFKYATKNAAMELKEKILQEKQKLRENIKYWVNQYKETTTTLKPLSENLNNQYHQSRESNEGILSVNHPNQRNNMFRNQGAVNFDSFDMKQTEMKPHSSESAELMLAVHNGKRVPNQMTSRTQRKQIDNSAEAMMNTIYKN